jgi:hypothetical protein
MVLPSAMAYEVLVPVGLLILVAFAIVFIFIRLERARKRIAENHPSTPVGWPTRARASAASPVGPDTPRAASSRPDGA